MNFPAWRFVSVAPLLILAACGGGGSSSPQVPAPNSALPVATATPNGPTPTPKPGLPAPTATPPSAAPTATPAVTPTQSGAPLPTPTAPHPATEVAVGTLQGHFANIFSPTANGNVPAVRTVSFATGTVGPVAVTFDRDGSLIACTLAPGQISVFAPNAAGSATPLRAIAGSKTAISVAFSLAVDSAGNIYAGNEQGQINVFAAGATGNVAPLRTIAGSQTGLQGALLQGLAVDGAGYLYAAVQQTSTQASILVFGPGASGNAAPARIISGPHTGLNRPIGLALDSGNELYVVNAATTIVVFAPGASGDANVARLIVSTALGMPSGIAVDGPGNVYVPLQNGTAGGGYVVFAAGSSGVATPLYQVGGTAVVWDQSYGIAVY